MRVYFIGAGPGAADLITVRGMNAIRNSKVILYAGSLVPQSLLSEAPRCFNFRYRLFKFGGNFLEIKKASKANKNVARVHSGDPHMVQLANKCGFWILSTLITDYSRVLFAPQKRQQL